MFEDIIIASSTVQNKPTIILKQVNVNCWIVIIDDAYTTWETIELALCEFSDAIKEFQVDCL